MFVAASGGEPLGLAALQVLHVLQRDAPAARLTALVVRRDVEARRLPRARLQSR